MKQINLLIYVVSYDEEPDQVCCLSEDDVQAKGGTAALESDMRRSCRWFAQVGRIEKQSVIGNEICLSTELLSSLIDAWKKRGAPKQAGLA